MRRTQHVRVEAKKGKPTLHYYSKWKETASIRHTDFNHSVVPPSYHGERRGLQSNVQDTLSPC